MASIYINGKRTNFNSVVEAKKYLAEQEKKKVKRAASTRKTTTAEKTAEKTSE